MGVVYRATQLDLDRPVALKLIAPAPGARTRRSASASCASRALAAAIDHPNVHPDLLRGRGATGTLYIAMRFVDGRGPAHARPRARARSSPSARRGSSPRSAPRSTPRTRAGLVHRDVKPANVLLGAGDHAYLTDFGLTKRALAAPALTRAGQLGRHARLRRARADPRRADRRARRRLRARLRALLRAHRARCRSSARATRRRSGRTCTTPADAAREHPRRAAGA